MGFFSTEKLEISVTPLKTRGDNSGLTTFKFPKGEPVRVKLGSSSTVGRHSLLEGIDGQFFTEGDKVIIVAGPNPIEVIDGDQKSIINAGCAKSIGEQSQIIFRKGTEEVVKFQARLH